MIFKYVVKDGDAIWGSKSVYCEEGGQGCARWCWEWFIGFPPGDVAIV